LGGGFRVSRTFVSRRKCAVVAGCARQALRTRARTRATLGVLATRTPGGPRDAQSLRARGDRSQWRGTCGGARAQAAPATHAAAGPTRGGRAPNAARVPRPR
jgi:hypothetical protein